MKLRLTAIIGILALIVLVSGGCTGSGTGSLQVSISNASALSAASTGIATVTVTATNGGVVLSAPIDYVGGQSSCNFSSVLTGSWTVEARGADAAGKAIYYGKTSTIVEKGKSSAASLTLKPINGEYEMSIDLTAVDVSKVASAEIWVYPFGGGSYAKKHIVTGALNAVHLFSATGMKPQTYEFQIRLFDSEEVAYYLSPWYVFDVLPASKTDVAAGLEFSEFSVSMGIEGIPIRPTILSMFGVLNAEDRLEVLIEWDQPEPDELDYAVVYIRFFDTTRFEEAYVYNPPTMGSHVNIAFSMESDDYHASRKFWARVVTVGKNGVRSLTSNERMYTN